ncbi:MAG: hypothetical protein NTY12_00605 [Candidatus Falkowbacteria bacterium]|nr:hypothetical protein [Candidatus Falkowbacteria bacterium]
MTTVNKNTRPKPVALIMLEGWGVAPESTGNKLIGSAPYFSHVIEHYPVSVLNASGEEIGLPLGKAGSGEIGHTVIGSGRLFYDARYQIDKKIDENLFSSGEGFGELVDFAKAGKTFHLIGLLSSSEKEASIKHLENIIIYLESKSVGKIYVHCILDGRETNKNSGQKLVEEFSEFLAEHKACQLVSLVGRLYGLDEKNNISRSAKAFQLFSFGEGNVFSSANEAFDQIYDKKIFDEEFPPVTIREESVNPTKINSSDVVIFWNHSGQGIRQLANYFTSNLTEVKTFTLVDYNLDTEVSVLFPKPALSDSLGKIFSNNNLRQLRLSESAGFPNVTTAFDYYSTEFSDKVDKKLIPASANVPLVENIIETIKETRRQFNEAVQKSVYDLIVVTFSQIDLMAHNQERDDLSLVVKSFDDNIKSMIEAVELSGGVAVIVGTHGFAEQTIDPAVDKEVFYHSLNPVPCYLIGKQFEGYNLGWPEAVGGDLSLLKPIGSLVDIAPTILTLANLPVPKEMVGKSLI